MEKGSSFPYDGKRWQRLRESILRRDGYQCRESRRYGKTVEATIVHHIYPAEEYPEYAWCSWNLISLSREAHNAMHDRNTGALTALGREWMRRSCGGRTCGGRTCGGHDASLTGGLPTFSARGRAGIG